MTTLNRYNMVSTGLLVILREGLLSKEMYPRVLKEDLVVLEEWAVVYLMA